MIEQTSSVDCGRRVSIGPGDSTVHGSLPIDRHGTQVRRPLQPTAMWTRRASSATSIGKRGTIDRRSLVSEGAKPLVGASRVAACHFLQREQPSGVTTDARDTLTQHHMCNLAGLSKQSRIPYVYGNPA